MTSVHAHSQKASKSIKNHHSKNAFSRGLSVKTKMLLKETKNLNLKRKYIDLLKYSTLGNKLVHFYANKYIKFAEVKLN